MTRPVADPREAKQNGRNDSQYQQTVVAALATCIAPHPKSHKARRIPNKATNIEIPLRIALKYTDCLAPSSSLGGSQNAGRFRQNRDDSIHRERNLHPSPALL